MNQIATITELVNELEKILSYVRAPEPPSRATVVSELRALADRVANMESQAIDEAKRVMDDLQKQWGVAYKAHQKEVNAPHGHPSRNPGGFATK